MTSAALHLEGLLDPDTVATLIERLGPAPFDVGASTARGGARQVKHNQQLDRDSPLSRELGNHVLAALGASPVFSAAAVPHTILPVTFARYRPGMHYGDHLDRPIRITEAGPLRTDLSLTVWLSEPSSYDGGELVVLGPDGERRYKGAAGDALLYRSDTVHRVEPVTRGERVVAITWMQSLVSSPEQRQVLFDLARLASRLGHDPAADRLDLTHLHHRLLRMWAR